MKPLIKWVGGKRKFLEIICSEINEYENYFEPFVGSAAVMLYLEPKKNITINDLNPNLINFYKAVKANPKKVHSESLQLINSGSDFYSIREEFNSTVNKSKEKINYRESAIFFYLNKMSFNGIYRVNSDGFFNTPIGRSASGPFVPSQEEFIEVSNIFNRTTILNSNWIDAIQDAKKSDLIYLDPPYYPDESSAFVGYTNPSFDHDSHDEMVKISKEKVDKGCQVLISNSASASFEKIVKKYFGKNYKRINIQTKRSINPNVEDKSKFIETLYVLGKNEINK